MLTPLDAVKAWHKVGSPIALLSPFTVVFLVAETCYCDRRSRGGGRHAETELFLVLFGEFLQLTQ